MNHFNLEIYHKDGENAKIATKENSPGNLWKQYHHGKQQDSGT